MNDFTTTVAVRGTAQQTYDAINDVPAWWGQDFEGASHAVGDEFVYWGKTIHRSHIRVVELVPGERVVWQVLDNHMDFVTDQSEWVGSTIRFELTPTADGTEVRFTHVGLVPEQECFETCRPAWTFFVTESLRDLVETGAGQPLAKERVAV